MRKFTFLVTLLTLFFHMQAQDYFLFVGTYTGTGSKGIYVYRFNVATGKATAVSSTENISNPSFLTLSPNGKTLYACNENASPEGGQVSAFRFNRKLGSLQMLNQQPTGGDHPCYVSTNKTGDWLMAGNYSGGSVAAFPVNGDGSLKPYSQLVQHNGRSTTDRQQSAHVHAAVFSPDGGRLFVPDLGMDKVMIYDLRPTAAMPLVSAKSPFVQTAAGSGPRHFTFHPNGKWAYLIEELSGSVEAYRYSGNKLQSMQRIFTHRGGAEGPFGSADIHVSPDGKFLYASNREGENNLAIFRIDQQSGKLSVVGYQSVLGLNPRNFCIDPSGGWLLVANQASDNVVVFKRNKRTGLLSDSGERLDIPEPVCLKMMK